MTIRVEKAAVEWRKGSASGTGLGVSIDSDTGIGKNKAFGVEQKERAGEKKITDGEEKLPIF